VQKNASERSNTLKKTLPWTRRHQLAVFFILAFAITWGIGAFAIFLPAQFRILFGELSDTHPLYYVAVAAPTISATTLALVLEGRSGLVRLYTRLVRWRFGMQWYALVLIGLPVLGWLVTRFTGSSPLKDTSTPTLLLMLLVNLLITGPLGEELGWRGYALPRLLKRFSPFRTSLILGIIWGIWHLPSFYISAMVQARLSLPLFLLNAVCLSFLASWLFMNTGGSVLITILLHYIANFCVSVLGVPIPAFTLLMLLAVVVVVVLDNRVAWFWTPPSLETRFDNEKREKVGL
jgi:membrane protease YdiL (CAAX protease family)